MNSAIHGKTARLPLVLTVSTNQANRRGPMSGPKQDAQGYLDCQASHLAVTRKNVSSAESVGELRLRKLSKRMMQGDFCRLEFPGAV